MSVPSQPCTTPFPLMRQLFQIIDDGEHSYAKLERRAGISEKSLNRIKKARRVMNMANFEAVANCLGYKLALVPIGVKDDETWKTKRHNKSLERSSLPSES